MNQVVSELNSNGLEAEHNLVDNFLVWSRLWSPFLDREQFQDAAATQDLSEWIQSNYEAVFNLFHIGFPAPAIPPLMHAALNLDGGRVREDIVRIMSFMDLQWSEHRLPPDHLAVLCDILAALLHEQQLPLAKALLDRYMIPWVTYASQQLQQQEHSSAAAEFLKVFTADVITCREYTLHE